MILRESLGKFFDRAFGEIAIAVVGRTWGQVRDGHGDRSGVPPKNPNHPCAGAYPDLFLQINVRDVEPVPTSHLGLFLYPQWVLLGPRCG